MSNRGTSSNKKGRRDARAERSERQRRRGHQEPATWAQADAETLLRAVVAWSEAGGMLGFGKTRDGGALTLCIWEAGSMDREYFRPSDDVTGYLASLVEEVEKPAALVEAANASRTHQEGPGASDRMEAYYAAWQDRFGRPHPAQGLVQQPLPLDPEP